MKKQTSQELLTDQDTAAPVKKDEGAALGKQNDEDTLKPVINIAANEV